MESWRQQVNQPSPSLDSVYSCVEINLPTDRRVQSQVTQIRDTYHIHMANLRHSLFLGALTLVVAQPAPAVTTTPDMVHIRASVRLRAADGVTVVPVETHEWNPLLGRRFLAFVGAFSLDLVATRIDSAHAGLTLSVTTTGATPSTRSGRYSVELDLPATLREIPGKHGANFELTLTPLEFRSQTGSPCEFSPLDSGDFSFDPTANFDLHFTPKSLADAQWNSLKNLLEEDYRVFLEAFDINAPGKIHYFLAPCMTPDFAWDERFGYALDPTRLMALGVYSHEFVSVSPIVAAQTRFLRDWGYAPPFIVEGLAGYFGFPEYETLAAKSRGVLIPLDSLVTTPSYYAAPPAAATSQAASFIKYLADTRGISRVRRLYEESDDLTIRAAFRDIYGVPLATLDSQWQAHLDTLHPPREAYVQRALIEGALNHLDLKREILEGVLGRDANTDDTARTLAYLAPLYSEMGLYAKARDGFRRMCEVLGPRHGQRPLYLHRVADLSIACGNLAEADRAVEELARLDTAQASVAEFTFGRLALLRGDTTKAIEHLNESLRRNQDLAMEAEAAIRLGFIYATPGPFTNPALATANFDQAQRATRLLLQQNPGGSTQLLRLGLALLGSKNFSAARQNLEAALFLEFRAQYHERAILALGNLADAEGKRDEALARYNEITADKLTATGRAEVARWKTAPFRFAK